MENHTVKFTLRLPQSLVESVDIKRKKVRMSRNDYLIKAIQKFENVSEGDLLDLIHWARRYCDGRMTYAPSCFNGVYKRIKSSNPDLLKLGDRLDETLMNSGSYWPYAQDGGYCEKTGKFDARPKELYFINGK